MGSAISLVGFIFRTIVTESFKYVIIGQTIMAFGYPFILNMPAKISAQWFKKEARLFTTMTGTNMCLIGYIAAYNLSNELVTINYTSNIRNYNEYFRPFSPIDCKMFMVKDESAVYAITKQFKSQIYDLMIIMAVLQIIVFFLILFLFSEMYQDEYGEFSTQNDLNSNLEDMTIFSRS